MVGLLFGRYIVGGVKKMIFGFMPKGTRMTAAQSLAYRFRRLILIAGIIFTVAGIVWAVLPYLNDFFDRYFEFDFYGLMGTVLVFVPVYGINVVLIVGMVLLGQWAFLRPGKGWVVRMTTVGRPLRSSVIAAGMIAMLLTTGLIALLLELLNWWEPVVEGEGNWARVAIWGAMLIMWGIWTWIFFVYWKQGDRYTQLGKMIHGLLAGTAIETIVAVPARAYMGRTPA